MLQQLNQAEVYVNTSGYVLNPDFIFVDKGFKSIDLVYLPLVKIEENQFKG